MDLNEAGVVDYGEFLGATLLSQARSCTCSVFHVQCVTCARALLSQAKTFTSPSLLSAFHVLDRDHDGFIDEADLRAILGAGSTCDTQSVFKDGRLTFEQFKVSSIYVHYMYTICTLYVHF